MADFSVFKVASLPQTFVANAMYLVPRGTDKMDVYVASSDGQSVRRIPTTVDIEAMIAAAGGGSGGSGEGIIYNTATRYEALSSAGYRVHVVSSSHIYTGLSWSRNGTVLTINRNGHGRSVGDRVIAKNVNVPVVNSLITNVTANSYDIVCPDSGDVSGTKGQYTCGFKFAHNSEAAGATTGGVLSIPSDVDIQLLSMRIHLKANSRAGLTYDLTIPTSSFDPAGQNTSNDTVYVPLQQVRTDVDTMTAVGNTIAMNQGAAGYSVFRFGALGATTSGLLIMMQF